MVACSRRSAHCSASPEQRLSRSRWLAKERHMTSETEIREKFWKHLKSERTIMLGLDQPGHHAQPMTVQLEGDEGGPLWIFSSKDTDFVRAIGDHARVMAQFVGK